MTKLQRLGRNSADNQVALVSGITDDIPLPEGVVLRDDAEMVIWRQFTHTRARADWRDFDLLLVAKAVRVEADIRKHQQVLDKTGVIIKNDRGTPIANPLLSIIDSLQRQQLAIIRSMNLNQQERDPRTMNASGSAQQGYRAVFDQLDDLIARP